METQDILERRKWLRYNEYEEALEAISSEVFAVRTLLLGSDVKDDYIKKGIGNLLETIAFKLDDMAVGRLNHNLLPVPELPENWLDSYPGRTAMPTDTPHGTA